MRIALVAQHGSPLTPTRDPDADAQATALTSLAQALAGLGHRPTIYARRDSRELPDTAILTQGVRIEHLTAGPQGPLADHELTAHVREFGDQLARRWTRSRPDVAHARHWTSGLAALAAARGLDVPVVQSFSPLSIPERRRRQQSGAADARVRLETCIARDAAAVLAGSSAEADELIRMGVPRTSLTVIPAGVDTEEFCPDGPAADRNGRARLLAISPLAEGHGLETLVHMLPGVPEAELVIAGGPPKSQLRRQPAYRALRQLARQLGVQRRLTFTGQVARADLPALLRSADLLVSAAAYDPQAAMTIAAMACGTPAAVTAVGGNRDAVLDEITGLLVPPGRPGLLARRVRQLLAAPMRLEAFGIAAADRASARYSWDRIGRETAAAYERCRPAAAETMADAAGSEMAEQLASLPDLAAARAGELALAMA